MQRLVGSVKRGFFSGIGIDEAVVAIVLVLVLANVIRITPLLSYWVCAGVKKVVTIERDPLAAAIARRFFDRSAFADKIELRDGDAGEELASLARCSRETSSCSGNVDDARRSAGGSDMAKTAFDLVFLDAGKRDYLAQRHTLVQHGLVRVGGLVVADNVIWAGEVPRHWRKVQEGDADALKPAQNRRDRVTRSLCEYVEETARDSRWQQLVMPLRDGLSIARRIA